MSATISKIDKIWTFLLSEKAAVVLNFCLIGNIRHNFLVPRMIELGRKTFMHIQTLDLHRVKYYDINLWLAHHMFSLIFWPIFFTNISQLWEIEKENKKKSGLTRLVFLSFEKLWRVKIGKTDSVCLFQSRAPFLKTDNVCWCCNGWCWLRCRWHGFC